MSEFIFVDYQRPSHSYCGGDEHKFCLCCLEKNVKFVNLATCKHLGILEKLCSISAPKMELGHLVCYRCHAKLKTINEFKLQAEESFSKLWSRQYSATKRSPYLKEVLLCNEGILPEELHTYRMPIKPEQIPVTEYPVVVSGSWLSDSHRWPIPEASSHQEMFKVPLTKIKKEHEEREECVTRNHGPKVSKISTKATNYHIEVSGLYPDSSQENSDMSDVYRDNIPLAEIKKEVEIEITELRTHEQVDTNTNLTKAAGDTENECFHCTHCNQKFESQATLRNHNITMHHYEANDNRKFSCSQSDYTSTTLRNLTKDQNLCLLCSKTFATKYSLKMHMLKIHENYQPEDRPKFQCKTCNKTYTTKHYLGVHIKAQHKPPSSPTSEDIGDCFYCDMCNKFFKNEHGLKEHLKWHRNHRSVCEKRYICDICKKGFNKKNEITEHMIFFHLKINQHTCPKCNKSYPSGSRLRAHVKYVHEKVRPPRNRICDHCGEAFTTSQILRSHIRRHTGERPYQCAQCPSTFTQNGALHTHIKLVHTKGTTN